MNMRGSEKPAFQSTRRRVVLVAEAHCTVHGAVKLSAVFCFPRYSNVRICWKRSDHISTCDGT